MKELSGINPMGLTNSSSNTGKVDFKKVSGKDDRKSEIKDSVDISGKKKADKQKDVTYLYYLDSQNAMSNEFSLKALQELTAIGSDKNTNVAVQIGCSSPDKDLKLYADDEGLLGEIKLPEWGGVRRYEITPDKEAKMVEALPEEVQMKQGQNLEDFIAWGMKKYNAKHYALVILEHGNAWKGMTDKTSKEAADLIRKGVQRANEATGDRDKIDLLFLQSCLMGSSEALSNLSKAADVVVGSENTIFAFSCRDVDKLLKGKETDEGGFDAKATAKGFVRRFKELNSRNEEKLAKYREVPEFKAILDTGRTSLKRMRLINAFLEKASDDKKAELFKMLDLDYAHGYQTLAALSSPKVKKFEKSFSHFAKVCKKLGIANEKLFGAIRNSKNFNHMGNDRHWSAQIMDLGDVLGNLLKNKGLDPSVKKAARHALADYREAIIAEQHDPVSFEGSTGMTIWGPSNAVDMLMQKEEYETFAGDFAHSTGWMDLMEQGMANMTDEQKEKFETIKPKINETVNLLKKFNDPSLPMEERRKLAKVIVANKNEIYKVRPEFDF